MPKFFEWVSTARYVFGTETAPLVLLLLKSNQSKLQEIFSFQGINVEQSGNQIVLTCGMGEWETIPIPILKLEGSILELQVASEEEDLERVFEAVAVFFTQIDPRRRFAERRLLASSVQAACVVQMNVAYERFFSESFLKFVSEQKGRLAEGSQRAVYDLNLSSLSFLVRYEPEAAKVPFLPRPLTIEPRAGTEPADRLFYVVAPLKSTDLRHVVDQLEDRFRDND